MTRLAAAIGLAACVAALADARGADLAGRWEGTAQVPGAPMPLVIDIEPAAGGRWVGSVVLPGRGVKGAALSDLDVGPQALKASLGAAIPGFGAPGAPPAISLALQSDGRLVGEFTLAGHRAALALRRSGPPQVDLPPANTPLSAALSGTWTGRYELGGAPRQVTLVLHAGDSPRAELTIVGRRTTQVPIDRIVQGPRFLTLASSAMGIAIEARHDVVGRLAGDFTQGPFEAPLLLTRGAAGAAR